MPQVNAKVFSCLKKLHLLSIHFISRRKFFDLILYFKIKFKICINLIGNFFQNFRLDGKMLKIIKSIEESSKIRLLTIEFEIICAAFEQNGQSAGEIFSKVRSSNASFYYALRSLSDNKLLIKTSDPFDRRISRYSVNQEFKKKIFSAFTEIQSLNLSDS